MKIKPKNVLSKSQMIINQLLSQLQNTQTNFKQEQFSIQLKNNNLLIVNFFEPDLQDIQWSIEFMGIRSLNHVSVSHDKRKKIRLLFWSLNSLHFFQGDLKLRQNRINFRNHFIGSQKIIPLNLPNTNDEILFISQDLFPDLSAGIFLISTIQRHFYVLKANNNQQDLIDLNPPNQISRIFSSITGFFVSRKHQKQQKNLRNISHILIRFPSDHQSFKAVIMEGFQIEVGFVNIPAIPGDMCFRDISLSQLINLEQKISAEIKGEQESHLCLISSSLARLSESQVAVLFLLRNYKKENTYFLVSSILCIQKRKGEITSTHHYAISQDEFRNIKDIEFEKIPESEELILKIQTKQSVHLNKMCIRTLKIIESVNYQIEGNTLLSKSTTNDKLLLLTPYSVYDINSKHQQSMIAQDQDQLSIDEEDQKPERYNSLRSLKNNFDSNQQKLKGLYHNNNFTEISKILDSLSEQVDPQLSIQKPNNISDEQVTQLLQIATALTFYQAFNSLEETSNSKLSQKQRAFQNISKRGFSQVIQIQQNLIKSQKWSWFLGVWINLLDSYKSKQYFQNQVVRQIQSEILNQNFSYIINKFFSCVQEISSDLSENEKEQIDKLILTLIRSCSGIIKIQRQYYHNLLKKPSNLNELKQVALDVLNFDLLAILYFESGQISQKQLQTCLKKIKPEALFFKFTQNFISEYISRMKGKETIHLKAKNLNNILSVFRNHQVLIERLFEQEKSDLSILIGLRLGERKKLRGSIISTSKRMKKEQNKQKLLLTTFSGRDQERMDEQ